MSKKEFKIIYSMFRKCKSYVQTDKIDDLLSRIIVGYCQQKKHRPDLNAKDYVRYFISFNM